ncbi:MAG: prepilin-type N-terminal cleavage/methylation domain-containing protein [Acidobacteriota bacterium]
MRNEVGLRIADCGLRISGEDLCAIRNPQSAIRNSAGFTLLELVMVMTIIVILAAVSVTSYQHIQLKARETILKQDLQAMRKLIDQYAADKEKLPQSLDDLVSASYMRDVPVDPMTGQKDWFEDPGEDTVSRDGGRGMVDVHSVAAGVDGEGVAYKEY